MERKEYKILKEKLKEAEQIDRFIENIDNVIEKIKDNSKLDVRYLDGSFFRDIKLYHPSQKNNIINPENSSNKEKLMELLEKPIIDRLESEKQKALNYLHDIDINDLTEEKEKGFSEEDFKVGDIVMVKQNLKNNPEIGYLSGCVGKIINISSYETALVDFRFTDDEFEFYEIEKIIGKKVEIKEGE